MSSILLRVYVTPFAEKGVEEAAKWSCDSAKEALKEVNAIWSKANIAFVMNDASWISRSIWQRAAQQ